MKYVKYFLNKTLAEGFKAESDFVAYLDEENKVLYSRGGEVIKDGEMVEDAPDPTEGFVDLGLSVMWASCNLGASSPEETGLFYSWGEVNGHELAEDGISLKDGHVFSNSTSTIKSGFDDISGTEYDAVKKAYDTNATYYDYQFRMPTYQQTSELLNNTTHEYTHVNGISGFKLTSLINNNFIFIPIIGSFYQADRSQFNLLWVSTVQSSNPYSSEYASAYGQAGTDTELSLFPNKSQGTEKWIGNQVRGICGYAPKHKVIKYGETVSLSAGENYFAILTKDITNTIFRIDTIEQTILQGLDHSDTELQTIYGEYTFETFSDYSELRLTSYEMDKHADKTSQLLPTQSSDTSFTWKYFKVICTTKCNLTVSVWDIVNYSDRYFQETALIYPGKRMRIKASSPYTYYRLRYADWKGGDMEISWSGSQRLPLYISDTCHYFLQYDDAHVIQYDYVKAKGSELHDAATIASWASRVDADGYLYVRFDASRAGYITFTSIKPTV